MTYFRQDITPQDRFSLAVKDAPNSLADAYVNLADFVRQSGEQWSSWKLGGTNHASRAAFGATEVYFGPLHRTEVCHGPNQISALSLCELRGEVEIALRVDAAGTDYDAWCVALEMPASPIRNLVELGLATLIADRCAAGALVLGPVSEGRVPDLSSALFDLRVNGNSVSAESIDQLVDSPGALLVEFLTLAREYGFMVGPGDWVATGGITACVTFSPNDLIEVVVDGQVVLAFKTARVGCND